MDAVGNAPCTRTRCPRVHGPHEARLVVGPVLGAPHEVVELTTATASRPSWRAAGPASPTAWAAATAMPASIPTACCGARRGSTASSPSTRRAAGWSAKRASCCATSSAWRSRAAGACRSLPGTQFVTVGGAIANDVHGKNHHAIGTFGDHVRALRLAAQRRRGRSCCGPDLQPDWFAATVGGLGLTGLIIEAELQLRRVRRSRGSRPRRIAYSRPRRILRACPTNRMPDWEHAVSWIDCTSAGAVRGLFMRAKPAEPAGAVSRGASGELAMPLTPPVSLVNRLTLQAASTQLYFDAEQASHPAAASSITSRSSIPLDGILELEPDLRPGGLLPVSVRRAARGSTRRATQEMLGADRRVRAMARSSPC